MKRKVFAIFCACLMTFSLVACGKTTSADSTSDDAAQVAEIEKPTPEATIKPEETAKPVVEETKPQEDKPVVQEPAEDTTQEDTATTDKTKPTDTDQGNGNNTDNSTNTDSGNTQQDITATDQQQTNQDQQTTQTNPTVDTGTSTSTSTTTVSGTFDIDNYVYNQSSSGCYYMSSEQLMIVYGSWFIEISTSAQTYSPGNAYISIGRWDYNATYWNNNTYSCVFSFGDGSAISSESYPDYNRYSISKTAISILPTLEAYMAASPQTDVAPNIPGYTFKPCQSDNPFVQY